ncbi:Alanine aminotransferase 2 [Asimina triloba]
MRNETKLGMSRGIPEPKLTAVDAMIDKLTGAIFLFQIVVVIVLGIAGNVWKDSEAQKLIGYVNAIEQWYVLYPKEGPWYELLVIPLRFELLCSIMIPISIKVSLDLVKSLYAKFIDWDEEMYDRDTNTAAHATNTAISEDLGQVEYILTDKTGTLTENRMIFRRCCINGTFYGNENGDALKDAELLNAIATKQPDVIRFLTVMAVCNTVIPLKRHAFYLIKNGMISYKAQSQDEDALVQAAAHLHFVLFNKIGNVVDVNFNASILQYEILDTLEFTSDRKRMSVVVRDSQKGNIILLSKGADEAILPYAAYGKQVRTYVEAVEQYAQSGLRTLCLGWRELNEDEYREWSKWKLAEACQRLEHDLEILGVTAIEDRLQDGVPETIETLRKAGINFWMLTGDKQNTAIQIALSCNFISPEPKGQLLLINGKTEDEVSRNFDHDATLDVAFVVDGWALEIALKHYRKAFTDLATLSRTAICCRVTPSQKAQLVELLKSCEYRTLAIGDGGNDVRMIQEADIGVGISGREGLQAARAADYSIGRLGTLLFIPALVTVLDKDLSESTVMQHPQILFYCQAGRTPEKAKVTSHSNERTYWTVRLAETKCSFIMPLIALSLFTMGATLQVFSKQELKAIVVFIISIHSYAGEKSEKEELSMVALSGCIWLQAFVVALETKNIDPNVFIFQLIVAAGMGPVLALKYFRYTYRSSAINKLQQAERLGGPIVSLGSVEPQMKSIEKDVALLSISQTKTRSAVYEPLLSDSPTASRRSSGPTAPFDFFQSSQSRLSSSYSRNCKDN